MDRIYLDRWSKRHEEHINFQKAKPAARQLKRGALTPFGIFNQDRCGQPRVHCGLNRTRKNTSAAPASSSTDSSEWTFRTVFDRIFDSSITWGSPFLQIVWDIRFCSFSGQEPQSSAVSHCHRVWGEGPATVSSDGIYAESSAPRWVWLQGWQCGSTSAWLMVN